MKVAVNAWFWDQLSVGSGQYLWYLVPALLALDPTLEILLVSPKRFESPPELINPRLRACVAPTPLADPASNLSKVWFEQVTFPLTCRRLGVDLAHVPYFGSPYRPLVPTLVTIHDLIPLLLPAYRGSLAVRLYTALAGLAAKRAALILADSEASRRDILTNLARPATQVRTVYLAQAPHYRPVEDSAELGRIKAKYRLPAQFVLYVGGYDGRKNVAGLLHAYALTEPSFRANYPLVLLGRLPRQASPLFTEPLALARGLGLEANLVTPGWVAEEDKPLVYAAATTFVYPSRYEGFGLPVLEAMAMGTPVVTTAAASLAEVAGTAALTVDPDDYQALAQAITRVCTDPSLRDRLVEAGRRQARNFSWAQTAQQTLQAYREAIR